MLSTPIVVVMPVKVPEAVVLREELHAAVVVLVVVVVLSFLAHDPTNAKMPTIKTIQNSNFFIITSLHYRKMHYYSYIYVPGMVLTNTGITPGSHNLKQLRNAPRHFFLRVYFYKKENATLIFRILSVSFCFCKISALTTLSAI